MQAHKHTHLQVKGWLDGGMRCSATKIVDFHIILTLYMTHVWEKNVSFVEIFLLISYSNIFLALFSDITDFFIILAEHL